MPVQRYTSRTQRLSKGFFDPRLKRAVSYDRIAGYFRSSIFEIAGESYEQVAGRIRIVCNSGLDVRDVETAKSLETAVRTDWCAGTPERMTDAQRPTMYSRPSWERCTQVLDKQDVLRQLKQGW